MAFETYEEQQARKKAFKSYSGSGASGATSGRKARRVALDLMVKQRGIRKKQDAESVGGTAGAKEPGFQRAVTHAALTGQKGSVGAGFQAPSQDEMEEMISPGSTKKRQAKRGQIAANRAGY